MDSRQLHLALDRFARERLEPSLPDRLPSEADAGVLQVLEAAFLEAERAAVVERAAQAPPAPDAFVRWFEALREAGPGQGDSLFPWLAESASLAQMRWFIAQEVAGEAGFDDLVALTQVKMPVQAKLELARNYWDEMGRGGAAGGARDRGRSADAAAGRRALLRPVPARIRTTTSRGGGGRRRRCVGTDRRCRIDSARWAGPPRSPASRRRAAPPGPFRRGR